MGADMVKIETDQENNFLRDLDNRNLWIGLTRGPDNHFYWTDGSRPGYTNWKIGQPNNWKGEEDCGFILSNREKWNDVKCYSDLIPVFVCETRK